MSRKILSRDQVLHPGKCALLTIDVQEYFAVAGKGHYSQVSPNNIDTEHRYYFDRLNGTLLPALTNIMDSCHEHNVEVLHTFVECLTKDGRDQSLDYKITGFVVPKGDPGARLHPDLPVSEDDIMIPKTSCSVFNSTNIEYVLRNLGISQLVITGIVTNQCIESAVRDAADRGFLVTLVEDACATYTQEHHDAALHNIKGFARIIPSKQLLQELNNLPNNKSD